MPPHYTQAKCSAMLDAAACCVGEGGAHSERAVVDFVTCVRHEAGSRVAWHRLEQAIGVKGVQNGALQHVVALFCDIFRVWLASL